jgi:hypothetical protein
MTRVERIEAEIAKLPPEDFRRLVRWLAERYAEAWDKQIEEDAAAGRLDPLWRDAEKEIAAGESRPLDDLLDHP